MRVVVGVAALLLAGCAAAPAPVAPMESAGTARALGFVWHVITQDGGSRAALLFAPAQSDNIAASLSCDRASRRVSIETFNPGTDGTKLRLESGAVVHVANAERLPADKFYGDAIVSVATLDVAHPVLAAFRENGSLATGAPPATMAAATQPEFGAIAEFFGVCG